VAHVVEDLFGHVILVFEDLMARYFERKESV